MLEALLPGLKLLRTGISLDFNDIRDSEKGFSEVEFLILLIRSPEISDLFFILWIVEHYLFERGPICECDTTGYSLFKPGNDVVNFVNDNVWKWFLLFFLSYSGFTRYVWQLGSKMMFFFFLLTILWSKALCHYSRGIKHGCLWLSLIDWLVQEWILHIDTKCLPSIICHVVLSCLVLFHSIVVIIQLPLSSLHYRLFKRVSEILSFNPLFVPLEIRVGFEQNVCIVFPDSHSLD